MDFEFKLDEYKYGSRAVAEKYRKEMIVWIVSKYGEPRGIYLYEEDAKKWLDAVGGGYDLCKKRLEDL